MSLAADNEALFRRIVDCTSRADIEGLLACFNDDVVMREMLQKDHRIDGVDGLRAYLENYFAEFDMSEAKVDFISIVANDTHVCGEYETTARFIGPGSSPGGDVVTWTALIMDRVVGGRVSEERVYLDARAAS